MRILYSHYLQEADHPAVRMINAIATELRELGHEVLVHASHPQLAPKVSTSTKKPSFIRRALWFARAIGRNRSTLPKDAAIIAQFRPDIILCRQDAYYYSMPLAARRAGIPLVTYADAPVAYETRHINPERRWHPPMIVEAIEKWVLRQSSEIVTVSTTAADILQKYHRDLPIHVVLNGVDIKRFVPIPMDRQREIRLRLGIDTPYVAGFVGTFRPFHGTNLLRDLIRLTAERDDLTWLMVGDGPCRAELQDALKDHRNVQFVGRRSPDEIPELLGAMNVLVLPQQTVVPDFYFCPLKILEGMAAGVVCMASAQGEIPHLLAHGKAGCIVDSTNPQDWVASLMQLLDDPIRRAGHAATARQSVEVDGTWGHAAIRIADILNRVTHSSITLDQDAIVSARSQRNLIA